MGAGFGCGPEDEIRETELLDSQHPHDDFTELGYPDREDSFREPQNVQLPASFISATRPGEIPYLETQHPAVGNPLATLDMVGYYNVRGDVGHGSLRPDVFIDKLVTEFRYGDPTRAGSKFVKTQAIDVDGQVSIGHQKTDGYRCMIQEYREGQGWPVGYLDIHPKTRDQAVAIHSAIVAQLAQDLPVEEIVKSTHRLASSLHVDCEIRTREEAWGRLNPY